jgi:hypothetical protein
MAGSHHRRSGSAPPVRTHPQRPRRRRNAQWIAAVITTLTMVIGGWLLAWFVWFAGPPHAAVPSSSGSGAAQLKGPPILVNVYHEGAQTRPVNGAFAFPNVLTLSKIDLHFIDTHGVTAWAVPRGGYDLPWTSVKVTVTARRRVRILQMRAVILSEKARPTGTLLEPAEQGAVENTAIDIGLSDADPVAMIVGKDGFPTREPYFKKYSYVLAPGEQATFEVTAYPGRQLYQPPGQAQAYRWLLSITLLDQNRTMNMLVKDSGGKPFATSGTTASTATFKAIYVECLYPEIPVAACRNVPRTQWTRR